MGLEYANPISYTMSLNNYTHTHTVEMQRGQSCKHKTKKMTIWCSSINNYCKITELNNRGNK